jgi:hypothetical protein
VSQANKWLVRSGATLAAAVESGESLVPYIEAGGGIYFWKLRLHPEPWESSDAASMVAWLERLTSTLHGRAYSKPLSHFMSAPDVELRGRGLTKDKQQYLLEFLQSARSRLWMMKYVESLHEFAPTLYVGETGDFRRRIGEHIKGLTDFGIIVQDAPDLTWDLLEYHYMVLSDFDSKPEKLRKTIEYISAALTIAGLTKRPG